MAAQAICLQSPEFLNSHAAVFLSIAFRGSSFVQT